MRVGIARNLRCGPLVASGFLVFCFLEGIDYGQPWRRTFGDNITYTDWQKDNYFYAVKKLVCGIQFFL